MHIENFIHTINKQPNYTEKEKTDAFDELFQLENSIFNNKNKYIDLLKTYKKKRGIQTQHLLNSQCVFH